MSPTASPGPGHNGAPSEVGPYAIYRTAKIKTAAELSASSGHMRRTRPTPNADPARISENRIIIGTEDPVADVEALVPKLEQRDADGLLLRRSNSVLAVEILATTSPEWWATATPEMQEDWINSTVDWLAEAWGGRQNLAHIELHVDETTPHITGYAVPLDERGALNCRKFIGEKQQLRDQQTGYALAVEHLGLQRGVAGSKATHQAVSRFYGALQAPQKPVQVPTPGRITMSPDEWAAEASRQMMKDLAPTIARSKTAALDRTSKKGAEATAAANAAKFEDEKAKRRELAAQMRELDLADVCDALALTFDPQEKVWKGDGFKIGLGEGPKAGKWFDYRSDYGRGGAIDLAQHVLGTDFNGALSFLGNRFGTGAVAADAAARAHIEVTRATKKAIQSTPPFQPPAPAPEYWLMVRRHLVTERALPASYVDRLHELGDLYADQRRNAVFLCRDEAGNATGAELKGTVAGDDGRRFTGLAAGSKKDRGGFKVGDLAKAATLYLVEAAIDAVSLFKIRRDAGERDFAVVSTAGVTPEPRTWFDGLARSVRRVCAFDADDAGDSAADKLRRHRFERMRPSRGKDWNDELRAVRDDAASSSPSPVSDPFLPDPDDNTPSL